MKSIVLFGGTFNPIHEGHLAMCQAAYEACSPEKVILLPSPSPHYKKNRAIVGRRITYADVPASCENLPIYRGQR